MSVQCSWCGAGMGAKPGLDGMTSHGMCPRCASALHAEMDRVEAGSIAVRLVEQLIEETQRARRIAALLLVLLAVALPAAAQTPLGVAPALTLSVGSAIDLGTSLSSIHSGRGQEGNPFLAHVGTPGLVAWKVGATKCSSCSVVLLS